MEPQIVVNWMAIACAVVAAFVFGFLWYGPILGNTWARLMGMDISKKPEPKTMMRAMILQLVGIVLISYVLTFTTNIWRPSVWNLGPDPAPAYMYGLYSAFFTWIGFYVPMQWNKVAWEGRPWGVFFINAAHDIINLVIVTQILMAF